MNKATKLRPRIHQAKQSEPVYRVPEEISDLVYQNFNTMVHRQQVTPGTSEFASQMIRESHFNKKELLELLAIIDGNEEISALSAEILGGAETRDWILSILHPDKKLN